MAISLFNEVKSRQNTRTRNTNISQGSNNISSSGSSPHSSVQTVRAGNNAVHIPHNFGSEEQGRTVQSRPTRLAIRPTIRRYQGSVIAHSSAERHSLSAPHRNKRTSIVSRQSIESTQTSLFGSDYDLRDIIDILRVEKNQFVVHEGSRNSVVINQARTIIKNVNERLHRSFRIEVNSELLSGLKRVNAQYHNYPFIPWTSNTAIPLNQRITLGLLDIYTEKSHIKDMQQNKEEFSKIDNRKELINSKTKTLLGLHRELQAEQYGKQRPQNRSRGRFTAMFGRKKNHEAPQGRHAEQSWAR